MGEVGGVQPPCSYQPYQTFLSSVLSGALLWGDGYQGPIDADDLVSLSLVFLIPALPAVTSGFYASLCSHLPAYFLCLFQDDKGLFVLGPLTLVILEILETSAPFSPLFTQQPGLASGSPGLLLEETVTESSSRRFPGPCVFIAPVFQLWAKFLRCLL